MNFQITKSGLRFSNYKESINQLNSEFNKKHYIKLSNIFDPELLDFVQSKLEKAEFYEHAHKTVNAKDFFMKNETLNDILQFLLNNKKLFALIEKITNCPKIGCFNGRVCRMEPTSEHYDDWHSDMIDNRLIALSINLSTDLYSGGTLQIKNVKNNKIIQEVINTGFGDAVLFRIAPYLNHRVTNVEGNISRTVFAGWFRAKPIYKPVFNITPKNLLLKDDYKISKACFKWKSKVKIQITKSGINFLGSDKDLECMRNEFNKNHCIKLPQLLEPNFLKSIQFQVKKAEFLKVNYPSSSQDNFMTRIKEKTSENLLRFLINNEKVFNLIQEITTCPKIGSFTGRICQMAPNKGHRDAWHNDLIDNRLIALSINLSTDVYSGGTLQILDLKSKKIIHEVANTGFGDGIIFRIAPYLNHRLTEVSGRIPRTFFAGWFRTKPTYTPLSNADLPNSAPMGKKTKISINSLLERTNEFYFHNSKGKLLMFNPKNSMCYGLDPVSKKILEMLKKPTTVSEIENMIMNEYDIDQENCKKDIVNLIKNFKANELITIK